MHRARLDRARSRGPIHCTLAAAIVCATLATATPATAEPYMALREGFTCGDCHVNRSGGGMRNVTAEMHAADILNLPGDGLGVLPAHDDWFSPQISEWFAVGGDFRLTQKWLFADDPDEESGEVPNNTAFRELDRNDFDIDRGTLYGHLTLIPETLSLYIDEQVAPGGATNREAWAILDGVLPWGAYIKGGRFFPGFGLKLEDDTAFVNQATGFNFDRTLSGVEIGRSAMGWNWFVSVSEGGNEFEMLTMASSYYMWSSIGPFDGAMLGGSFARAEPNSLQSLTFAGFGGLSYGPLTVLAQGGLIDTERRITEGMDDDEISLKVTDDSWVAYVEANYLAFDWLNVKLAFDWLDPDDGQSQDDRNRVSIGLEPFLARFLQLRAFYRVYNGPEDEPITNRDELTLEAHLFF